MLTIEYTSYDRNEKQIVHQKGIVYTGLSVQQYHSACNFGCHDCSTMIHTMTGQNNIS